MNRRRRMIRFDRSEMRAGFGRERLLDLLEHGLAAIDPERRVLEAVGRDGQWLRIGGAGFDVAGRRVWTIAIGKAAVPMAEAALERLGSVMPGGIVVTRRGHGGAVAGLRVVEAGHPIPDESGHRAAEAVADLAERVGERDLVLCLLSGGGSALLASPPDGTSLADIAETTRILLGCGAPIEEVNTMRP